MGKIFVATSILIVGVSAVREIVSRTSESRTVGLVGRAKGHDGSPAGLDDSLRQNQAVIPINPVLSQGIAQMNVAKVPCIVPMEVVPA
jgi:hypothetical protein